MKKVFFLITTIILSFSVNAQKDPKAKALLDDVYNKVKSYDNIYIDFKYALDNSAENIHQETKGDVTIQGDKYVFNYLGATKIFDGSKTYTIIPENEEVVIEVNEGDSEGNITPSKMLTFYKEGYNYSWDILQDIKGRKIQFVKLTPIDSNSEIKEILLGIDAQTKHIYNLIEVGSNGTKTTITVNSFKTNEPISKSMFTFNQAKYDDLGYYIIEN
ncbi:LolA family protein [Galbibacter pacificus]|uniref:Outer membrane lipoprotein carrier protein LolA n=1 Tax=Galbibacter pacificus TaxID=2996052 RepID=A0ABT6FPR2_9FLAO|nr:outer membrane lipoprotein carrier protein LolA [Galbibacter pacificus]MDG3582266.1 outer membrane lipoprotein carrier protein LolA [Galbibacter pacificus]MDG3585258.1 outer membrane lipoprotein carrier protein LolA [Galbibacter pacificus]